MGISAADVKLLREKTGAGMMDCKKALVEADGDFARAERILKELGLAAAAKRSGRDTNEGRIFTHIAADRAGIIEIACETDFVARSDEFVRLGNDVVKTAVEQGLAADSEVLAGRVQEAVATIKENMSLARVRLMDFAGGDVVRAYIHGDAGSVGTLVKLAVSDGLSEKAEVQQLAFDLALHAAAFAPSYLDESRVPAAYLAEQEAIFRAQAENLGKPPAVLEGITKGKLKKHLAEICFVDQGFVKDEKTTVGKTLENLGKQLGGTIVLADYAYFRVGEDAAS